MATISKTISSKIGSDGLSKILIRLSLNRTTQIRIKTEICIPPQRWDAAKQRINIGKLVGYERTALIEKESQLKDLEAKIYKICEIISPETITKQWLENVLLLCSNTSVSEITPSYIAELLDKQENPSKYAKRSIYEVAEEFLQYAKYSEGRKKHYQSVIFALHRYEMFIRLYDKNRKDYVIELDAIDKEFLLGFEDFLRNEHSLCKEDPSIYKKIQRSGNMPRALRPRGHNTICSIFDILRTFFNWCNSNRITDNRPFVGYNGTTTEKYGTPYYITIEERNHIAEFDLSEYPALEVQRDIFIFQCCIGCRVSDLKRLTKTNIVEGEINYIARKTKDDNPVTIKVPINARAKALIQKYEDVDKKGRLFPFIADQNYNYAIKDIFRICGIDRMVTILNPITGEEESKPICEVASSHMARRTFVGNLYKKVKDPNLICPMSGHQVGSSAFARYREIDKETRLETIKLID